MKKTLLTVVTVALSAFAGWAETMTMNFEGENDMGNLTRYSATSIASKSVTPQTASFEYTDGDISLTVKNTTEDATEGIALVYNQNTATQRGIWIYDNTHTSQLVVTTTPLITLKATDAVINKVVVVMQGQTAAIQVNETDVTANGPEAGLYTFTWTDAAGTDEVNITWTYTSHMMQTRYIHSIQIDYTPDLGDKEACGLSFSKADAEAIIGQEWTAPTLDNPNNLDVNWSSSEPSVATVNENGEVTLVGAGTTTIKAETSGNDQYAKGFATYTLSVMGSADSAAAIYTLAPKQGDQVYVNVPLLVTFTNSYNVYVRSEDGSAAQLYDAAARGASSNSKPTTLKIGDIIPAGWIATNDGTDGIKCTVPTSPEHEDEVEYPVVESIDYAEDAYRVVILKGVSFETNTVADMASTSGKVGDTTYTFQNTFGATSYPPGVYDVTLVVMRNVRNNKAYEWLAPLSFVGRQTKLRVTAEYYPRLANTVDYTLQQLLKLDIPEADLDEEPVTYEVNITGEVIDDEITITIQPLSGSDGYVGMRKINTSGGPLNIRRAEENEPVMLQGTQFTFPADGNLYTAILSPYTLVDDEMEPDADIQVLVTFKVDKIFVFPKEIHVTCDAIIEAPDNGDYVEQTVTLYSNNNLENVEKIFPGSEEQFKDAYVIAAKGETELAEVTMTLQNPTGFTGYYYKTVEMPSTTPSDSRRKINKVAESEGEQKKIDTVDEWVPAADFNEDGKLTKGNEVIIPSDGKTYMTTLFLCKGEEGEEEIAADHPIIYLANYTKSLEFPTTFEVTVDPSDLEVAQEDIDDVYSIEISGEADADKYTVTLAVPEGWDGYYKFEGSMSFSNAKAAPAVSTLALDKELWMSIEDMEEEWPGLEKGNTAEIEVDSRAQGAMFFLYKGEQIYNKMITVQGEVVKKLSWPEEFVVEADAEDLEIKQENDEGGITMTITGKTDKNEVTLTFDIPEGWDGLVGGFMDDFGKNSRRKARTDWPEVTDLVEQIGASAIEGKTITLKADGERHVGSFYLYVGNQYDEEHSLTIAYTITKDSGEVEAVFPESFEVTLEPNEDTLTWSQGEEQGVYTIKIGGTCKAESVKITMAVPDGYDGYLVSDPTFQPNVNNGPAEVRRAAEAEWVPVDALISEMGFAKSNSLSLTVGEDAPMCQFVLYKGDMADMGNPIAVEFEVEKNTDTGIEGIDAEEAGARYFTLDGVEVSKPVPGVYVKISNGKAYKVIVK